MASNTDVTVVNHGSVVQFSLHTDEARKWVSSNVQSDDWQWLGGDTLVVDHRYAQPLVFGMIDAGLDVQG